jgi:hypothetical protein
VLPVGIAAGDSRGELVFVNPDAATSNSVIDRVFTYTARASAGDGPQTSPALVYPARMRLAFLCMCVTIAGCADGAKDGDTASNTSITSASMTTPTSGGSSSGSGGDEPTQSSAEGTATGVISGTTGTPDDTSAGPGTGPGPTSTPQTETGTEETTATATTTLPDDTSGGPDDTTAGDNTTDVEPACPCPDLDVPLDDGIFVLSKQAALWKFFPDTNKFTMLGPVDCGLPPSTFSMGVDREGYAWVQFSDLQIRKVDVTDTSNCVDPGFVPLQQGIENFGMAFVSNSASDKCDRIFGNHYNGVAQGSEVSEFFSIDPVNLGVSVLGYSDYGLAEVTGTGDGRAFLFAGPDPSDLVWVDRDSGATLEVTPLPGVKTGGGFAFAFFAGDFYFFTDAESDMTSEVTHIDYDDSDMNGKQDITVVVQDAPLRIVGAGVSTCAPVVPQ